MQHSPQRPFWLTSIEAEEALIAKHLLGTVKAVLVHQFSDEGSGGPLVLHAGLHQVDGVDRRRARSCDKRTQSGPMTSSVNYTRQTWLSG